MASRTDTTVQFRQALGKRVLVADGAMGTMLQEHDLTLDDFEGYEGCNEILNVTRPDVVKSIHDAYFAAGADLVETNTFGANLANLGEYDIADRIYELSQTGAALAREVAETWSTEERSHAGFWVRLGRLPSCPRSATRRSPTCATRTSKTSPDWSTAALMSSSSRPPRTCCRPRHRCWVPSARWPRPVPTSRSSSRSPSRPPARFCSVRRSAPAEEHNADVIGMSGLLVKSTVIMKENLEEINSRGVADRWARPARRRGKETPEDQMPERSDVAPDNRVPEPPFWGDRVVKGIPLADYAALLDERATFMGRWVCGVPKSDDGPSYEQLVESEGRPRMRMWLDRMQTDNLLEAAVVYGYYPCVSKGDDLVVLDEEGGERCRFTFPRQRRDRHLCLSDFFRPESSGETDVVGFTVVTMGSRISEATAKLFEEFQLHPVQSTDAIVVHHPEAKYFNT